MNLNLDPMVLFGRGFWYLGQLIGIEKEVQASKSSLHENMQYRRRCVALKTIYLYLEILCFFLLGHCKFGGNNQ